MESVDQGKFTCGGCGKSYKWKPELAGKKVKCKCGTVMSAPASPPAPPEEEHREIDLDGLYELAAEEKKSARRQQEEPVGFRCPSCHGDLAVGAVICTGCGFNLKTGSKATASKPKQSIAYAGGSPAPSGPPSAMAGYAGRAHGRGLNGS